jgi:MATE family multidrug resistance protein
MNLSDLIAPAWKDWKSTHRYRSVIQVCIPLVMSTAAITVMEFTDRVFLSNYSLDAIAAATPAGVVAFLFIVFFSGVAGYGSVFIAQYTGAGTHPRVGAVLWQTVYFALAAGIALAGISLLAVPIFKLGGHAPEIQRLEVIYFRILCLGALLHVLETGLSSFFTGRGMTRPVMVINTAGMLVNIPLDYALINGLWGFPELGITGAALATVFSWGFILVIYAVLIFTKANDRQYLVRKARSFDRDLFIRLMKYGIPGSLQFCLDVFAFMFFIFMVGRIGKVELAVSNIIMSINSLAFMPTMGFSQGVSTLVGQSLGKGRPQEAKRAVWSATHVLLVYILMLDIIYLFAPQLLISLFIPSGAAAQDYASIAATGRTLLRIVAVYVFMDALYMIFVGALRGAGDTRFIMWSIGIASLAVMVLPVYIGIEYFQMGVYYAWICTTTFVASLFILSSWRYRQGKWQEMLVVEKAMAASSPDESFLRVRP